MKHPSKKSIKNESIKKDNMWNMEAAEPRIYQLHMKDLEYKKKALLANEKNIFKTHKSGTKL